MTFYRHKRVELGGNILNMITIQTTMVFVKHQFDQVKIVTEYLMPIAYLCFRPPNFTKCLCSQQLFITGHEKGATKIITIWHVDFHIGVQDLYFKVLELLSIGITR